jgi:hypothetical protein
MLQARSQAPQHSTKNKTGGPTHLAVLATKQTQNQIATRSFWPTASVLHRHVAFSGGAKHVISTLSALYPVAQGGALGQVTTRSYPDREGQLIRMGA